MLALPSEPVVKVFAGNAAPLLTPRNLWEYRELLYFLIWRDLKIRYKQSALGATWAIIQPLCTMLLFAFFFGRLVGINSAGIPYPVFAYSGLVLWVFLANSLTTSSNSLVGNANLITKIYFPRAILPIASVLAGLVDLAISSILLLPLLLYYRVTISWSLTLLPIFIVLVTMLAIAIGMWMSALNVKYRDVRHALPFLIQLWMFASPVIYPFSVVTGRWKWAFAMNPLTGIIEGFRAALVGRAINWTIVLVAAALTMLLFAYAVHAFKTVEKTFADII